MIEIESTKQPELANAWGVPSLTTAFIIDSNGQPRGVNHGVASEEKVGTQLVKNIAIPQRRLQEYLYRLHGEYD